MSAQGPFHSAFPQPSIVVSIRTSFDGTTTWTLAPVSRSDEPMFALTRVQEGGYHYANTRERRLRASHLENLARLIEEARLPMLSPGLMGVDGTTYSVEIRVGMGGGTWSWWSQPREGWEVLAEIVREIERLGGMAEQG